MLLGLSRLFWVKRWTSVLGAAGSKSNSKTFFSFAGSFASPSRLLSRPSGTLSSVRNGGEGRGEEALVEFVASGSNPYTTPFPPQKKITGLPPTTPADGADHVQ